MIVYASIGNSDDKLTQFAWSCLVRRTTAEIRGSAETIHGIWHSAPDSEYQNACFCFEISNDPDAIADLKRKLSAAARDFKQDSIAWAAAPVTEFI